MDKRHMHHLWTKLRRVKPWYLLAAAGVSGVACVLILRQNNLHMVALRDAVYKADQRGIGVETALQNLQGYVTTHMNTDLSSGPNSPYPPIQLEYAYDRAVRAAGEASSAANTKVYTDAQHHCEAKIPDGFSGRYRIECVQAYVNTHATKLPAISDSLYKFNFLSPWWSPDLAGWSMVVTVMCIITAAGLWVTEWLLHRYSR